MCPATRMSLTLLPVVPHNLIRANWLVVWMGWR